MSEISSGFLIALNELTKVANKNNPPEGDGRFINPESAAGYIIRFTTPGEYYTIDDFIHLTHLHTGKVCDRNFFRSSIKRLIDYGDLILVSASKRSVNNRLREIFIYERLPPRHVASIALTPAPSSRKVSDTDAHGS